jgi:Domain of unknown function (DUF4328)
MTSAGEWACPDCHSINLASSSRCYSCHRALDPATMTDGAWTPVPPDHQGGRSSAPGYRSATTRARGAQILVGIVAAAHGVVAISGIYELLLVDRILDGSATDAEVTGYLQFADTLGLLVVLLTIISGIAVLAWLSRTVEIVPALGGGTPRRSPREAIGWWFVPIANLFIPYVIVRDAYARLGTPTRRGGDAFVLAWWLLFIVGDGVCRVAGIAINGASSIDDVRGVGIIIIVANIATSLGGFLLVWIIGEIDARARERATPRAIGDAVDGAILASPVQAAE